MLDALGQVSELATANLMLVKDGEVHTPVPNGTFLVGITRDRVIDLLRRAGITVHERSITWQEFIDADEVFSTGNYGKVLQPVPGWNRAISSRDPSPARRVSCIGSMRMEEKSRLSRPAPVQAMPRSVLRQTLFRRGIRAADEHGRYAVFRLP